MAISAGHADVAALLLEYDANKDCRTKTGITPLFQVCMVGIGTGITPLFQVCVVGIGVHVCTNIHVYVLFGA